LFPGAVAFGLILHGHHLLPGLFGVMAGLPRGRFFLSLGGEAPPPLINLPPRGGQLFGGKGGGVPPSPEPPPGHRHAPPRAPPPPTPGPRPSPPWPGARSKSRFRRSSSSRWICSSISRRSSPVLSARVLWVIGDTARIVRSASSGAAPHASRSRRK